MLRYKCQHGLTSAAQLHAEAVAARLRSGAEAPWPNSTCAASRRLQIGTFQTRQPACRYSRSRAALAAQLSAMAVRPTNHGCREDTLSMRLRVSARSTERTASPRSHGAGACYAKNGETDAARSCRLLLDGHQTCSGTIPSRAAREIAGQGPVHVTIGRTTFGPIT